MFKLFTSYHPPSSYLLTRVLDTSSPAQCTALCNVERIEQMAAM